MTGKSRTIVAEWVLMAAAELNDVLALKYSERTNHQWLSYFILSRIKTYIKNSITWIRFVKKDKTKQKKNPNNPKKPNQRKYASDKAGGAPTLSHPQLQQHNGWRALKRTWRLLRRSRLCFSKTWQSVEHSGKSTRGGKENLHGRRMGILSVHLGTLSSGTSGTYPPDRMSWFLLLMEGDKLPPGRRKSLLWYMTSTIPAGLFCYSAMCWGSPRPSCKYSSYWIQVSTLWS